MEKRKVSILVDGQPCVFYSDDPEEYLYALTERANAVLRETARFSGPSVRSREALSVLSLTDTLMRTEQQVRQMEEALREKEERKPREARKTVPGKTAAKAAAEEGDQVSVWDLLD